MIPSLRKNPPKYELLREAMNIIRGIPEKHICLDCVHSTPIGKEEAPVYCGLGWLAQQPMFNSIGLTMHQCGLYVNGRPTLWYHAAKEIFNLTASEAILLFNSTHTERLQSKDVHSDKEILLIRLESFLYNSELTNRRQYGIS